MQLNDVTLALIQNAALLLAMAAVFDLATSGATVSWSPRRKVFAGLAAGTIGAAMVVLAIELEPGVIFDTRSVLLSVSGLFLGLIPTLVAMLITAIARLGVGGAAAWYGVAVLLASGIIGLAWRWTSRRSLGHISSTTLFAMGISVHLVMLAILWLIPDGVGSRVVGDVGLPIMLVHPLATVALGALLRRRLRRQRDEGALREQEARLRLALEGSGQSFFDYDVPSGIETVSGEYATLLGGSANGDSTQTRDEWIDTLHPDDRDHATTALEDYLAGNVPEYRVESRRRRLDGTYVWTLSRGSIVARDPDGKPLRLSGTIQDISALKQAEFEARHAEALAQSTLDALDEHICVLDADGKVVAVNAAWSAFAEENGAGRGTTFVGADYLRVCRDTEGPEQHMATNFAEGLTGVLEGRRETFAMEYPCHAPGAERWFRARVTRFPAPGAARVVIAHEDITDRMLAERDLRKVMRAVEQSPVSIVITDIDGNIEYVNPRFVETTGYRIDELIGRNPRILKSGLTPPERYRELWQTITRGDVWHGVFANRKKNGDVYWDQATIAPVRGVRGEIVGYVGAKLDISERLEAERERDRLTRILEASQRTARVGSWEIDLMNDEWFASEEVYRIFEIPAETFEPTIERVLSFFANGSAALAKQNVETLVETGSVPDLEAEIVTPSGSHKWVHLSATATFEGDLPMRVTGSVQDITERKAAEGARIELTRRLGHMQRMDSLGSLAGGVAHDLNNVLSAISNVASTHRRRLPEDDPITPSLDTISKACERGRSVVASLLYFARENAGVRGPVDLNAITREVTGLLGHTTLERIRLVTELEEPLDPIEGDASATSQALMNLCINSIDAMPDGGRLTIRTRRLDGNRVELAVIDDGAGMTPEVLERAADPFFTTKPPGKGTGLGLAMVYGTVTAHGGSIEIRSNPGRGTEVVLTFPVTTDAPSVSDRKTGQERSTAHLEHVLLVDDDDLILETFVPLLEGLGHRVTACASGPAALDALAGGLDPDLVILDMNMPGMTGGEVLPRILTQRPEQRVLICTGYSDQDLTELMGMTRRISVIRKPFTVDELQDATGELAARE